MDRSTHPCRPLRLPPVALAALLLAATGVVPMSDARASDDRPRVDNPHGNFKEDCSLCHSATAWKPARISPKFDHEKYGIPLKGAHASVKCTQCHTSLDFSKASASCVDCHSDVHNGELGTDCSQCHGTRSFIDRDDQMRMHRLTRFPLSGAHQTLDCEMCHRLKSPDRMSFVNTPTECESCHMADYNATTSPNHLSAGFSRDCASCHNDQAWSRTRFDHSQTGFPLTGAHLMLHCDRCHPGNQFTPLSTECVSCHQKDYDGTNDPAHGPAGFPTDCAQCHSTKSWSGADFDHSTTGFALTGAHLGLACEQCHVGGKFSGLSTACVSCHQKDYDGTTDPNHAGAGFPTDCTQCHTTTRWSGATFNHTWFPIYSGRHAGTWTSCADCHADAANYQVFNCLGCHPHDDKAGTDSHHQGMSGYSYSSDRCYFCHPNGTTGG